MKNNKQSFIRKLTLGAFVSLYLSNVYAEEIIHLHPFFAQAAARQTSSKSLPCTSTRKFNLLIDVKKLTIGGKSRKLDVLDVRVGNEGLKQGQQVTLISDGFKVVTRSPYQVTVTGLQVKTSDEVTSLLNGFCRFKTKFPVYVTVSVIPEKGGQPFIEEHKLLDNALTL